MKKTAKMNEVKKELKSFEVDKWKDMPGTRQTSDRIKTYFSVGKIIEG